MRTQPFLAALLLAPCLVLSATPARADMIGTDQLLVPAVEAQHAQVDAFLAREDVRRQLEANGVDPADAETRVASLTEAELQVVANGIDTLPAGADRGISTLGLILIIVLIVVLI